MISFCGCFCLCIVGYLSNFHLVLLVETNYLVLVPCPPNFTMQFEINMRNLKRTFPFNWVNFGSRGFSKTKHVMRSSLVLQVKDPGL